jgi:hypothetical protein
LVNGGTKQFHGHDLQESVGHATVSTIHTFAKANWIDISISMYHFTEFYKSLAAAENRIIPHLSSTVLPLLISTFHATKCVRD